MRDPLREVAQQVGLCRVRSAVRGDADYQWRSRPAGLVGEARSAAAAAAGEQGHGREHRCYGDRASSADITPRLSPPAFTATTAEVVQRSVASDGSDKARPSAARARRRGRVIAIAQPRQDRLLSYAAVSVAAHAADAVVGVALLAPARSPRSGRRAAARLIGPRRSVWFAPDWEGWGRGPELVRSLAAATAPLLLALLVDLAVALLWRRRDRLVSAAVWGVMPSRRRDRRPRASQGAVPRPTLLA